jgi:NAD(P)-dependent dehydrogenase (short-subunit alcohol dehydrogenase family)
MLNTRSTTLITGGSRGLGRAIADRLASEGMAVGLLARGVEELEAAADSLREGGAEARAFACDVRDATALGRAFERFRNWAGPCDVLVCAAGRLQGIGPMETVDPDAWWADLETSVRGSQQTIRAALPALRESQAASISVLVGPGHHVALPFAAGYGAGQAALVRLVECLAHELDPSRIPVYAVYPGIVPTSLTARLIEHSDARRWLPQFNEAFSEGKEVHPSIVAESVHWLATRRPSALSGRVVPAPLSPAVLETRLERIAEQDLGVLRLR